ncbi:hypothetical protein RhiTH_010514 [Rhizoctonia solani]
MESTHKHPAEPVEATSQAYNSSVRVVQENSTVLTGSAPLQDRETTPSTTLDSNQPFPNNTSLYYNDDNMAATSKSLDPFQVSNNSETHPIDYRLNYTLYAPETTLESG